MVTECKDVLSKVPTPRVLQLSDFRVGTFDRKRQAVRTQGRGCFSPPISVIARNDPLLTRISSKVRFPLPPPVNIMAAAVLNGCREVLCGVRAARGFLLGALGRGSAGQGGDHSLNCSKSTYSALPDDYNCKVDLAMTSDGKTIVCYHPSVDIPYEHTKPLPRRDPVKNHEESHDQVLKARLIDVTSKREPTMEELSKMFYTTKHRWYPVGQYHRRRMKKEHLKDR